VFVDCKFYDIPNTMEAAVRAVFDEGATLTTVHAMAGKEALSRLAELEAELNSHRPFKILAVTILTSYTQESLPPNFSKDPISHQVQWLADLALESGITGLVCSAHEVQALRARYKEAYIVTPGIRFPNESLNDQK